MTATPHRGDVAPGYLLYLTEPARAAFDHALLAYATPLFAALPRGDNHPVLVLPRLHGGHASTSTLRTVLKQLGYRTYGWQLGSNVGPTSKVVHGMRARLDYLTNRYQRPVTLIGWSLAASTRANSPEPRRRRFGKLSPWAARSGSFGTNKAAPTACFTVTPTNTSSPLTCRSNGGKGRFRSRQRRSTPCSMGSSPGGPAWTNRRLARRTSPFLPATSASPITLRRFGLWRTASPSPPTNGNRFNRRRYCARPT